MRALDDDHDLLKEYKRKNVADLDNGDKPLVVQAISVEEMSESLEEEENSARSTNSGKELGIYGLTKDGDSVVVFVKDFLFYFYVEASSSFKEDSLAALKEALGAGKDDERYIDISVRKKYSIYGFDGLEKRKYLKIMTKTRTQLLKVKKAISTGVNYGRDMNICTQSTYESNIPQVLRFMIDTGIKGMSWIEIPPKKYSVVGEKKTKCHIEVEASYKDIIAYDPEGEHASVGPLKMLSFDIECSSIDAHFPKAQNDSVIQIGNVLSTYGKPGEYEKVLFTLKSCAPIVGVKVLSYEDERELLMSWKKFVVNADPDVITGFNINGFDFPYILDRAAALKLENFPYLSRMEAQKTKHQQAKFSSKAYGIRDSKMVNMSGRIVIDVLEAVQREFKLRSYTLNSVSYEFLGDQKEDVHHSIINTLQEGTSETRKRLGVYCIKDSLLPLKLIDKTSILNNYIELTRVTGVPLGYILSRGQQVRVMSLLYREANAMGYIIPVLKQEDNNSGEAQFEGATVIEPEKGYYDEPIVTMDFSSLYPSIMIAHNLCYSTYLESRAVALKYGLIEDRDYVATPDDHLFIKSNVRPGVLSEILSNLIRKRTQTKQIMKNENDPTLRAMLDGRQLAFKLTANSVYGFTASSIGKLYLHPLCSSITAYGRKMIMEGKKFIEKTYSVANGYEKDARVIYGDTDSLMVAFGNNELESAIRIGNEAAAFLTSKFLKPIKLEFEKVYFPYLLISKKRYAGLQWTNTDHYDKLDTKGVETVRRDSCRLVSNVIQKCLTYLLIDRDTNKAIDYVKSVVSDILMDHVDMSQLVITKSLGRTEYVAKQAHNELAIKMRGRGDGAPSVGDRVSYVIVKGAKGDLASSRAEDPIYVLENGLPLDTSYYLQNQLSNPVKRIFTPIIGNKVQDLFEGSHVMRISKSVPKNVGIMKFAVKMETCLGCRTKIEPGVKSPLCRSCLPFERSIHQQYIEDLARAQTKYCKLWVQCQHCQNSLHQKVLCTASDCPIFYMRVKARMDVENMEEKGKRFLTEW